MPRQDDWRGEIVRGSRNNIVGKDSRRKNSAVRSDRGRKRVGKVGRGVKGGRG